MDLFKKYDASLRELAMYSREPKHLHEYVMRKLLGMAPPQDSSSFWNPGYGHIFPRIEPSQGLRGVAEKTIAS